MLKPTCFSLFCCITTSPYSPVLNVTDLLVGSFILEHPVCQLMFVWINCVSWLLVVYLPVFIFLAPVKCLSSSLCSAVGYLYIPLQFGVHNSRPKNAEGTFFIAYC